MGEGAVWVTAAPPSQLRRGLPELRVQQGHLRRRGQPAVRRSRPISRCTGPAAGNRCRWWRRSASCSSGATSRPGASRSATSHATTRQRRRGLRPYTCFSNAKAYARNLDVIGVIGAYNSGCSDVQIPVANQAPDGALAMISPSNTWNGLTRPYEGMRRGELEARYPSGERNYVRIAAADHLQSVANATLVKELGLQRPVRPVTRRRSLLHRRRAHGSAQARAPDRRLRQLEHRGSEFARLARRIARTHAEAVFIAGFLHPHGGALVRDLRAQLGRRRGPDGARLLRAHPRPVVPRRARCAGNVRQCVRRREQRASAARKAPPQGARGCLWERAELAVDRRCTPRKRPRSCSTRSLAPTARARR